MVANEISSHEPQINDSQMNPGDGDTWDLSSGAMSSSGVTSVRAPSSFMSLGVRDFSLACVRKKGFEWD